MTACCPNCSSGVAIGGEVASVCTECATVSVAGASFSPLMMLAAAAGAAAFVLACWTARRLLRSPRLAPQPA